MTRISVAMCTLDGDRFLGEQLASIAAQDRPPDELVVVDDGSTDTTMALLAAFAATATFPVEIHRNDRTLGSTRNFERALGLCTGDVLVLCDQDDVWRPAWLGMVEATFAARPEVGLVFTDAELIDDAGRPLARTLWQQLGVSEADLAVVRSPHAIDLLLEGSIIAGMSMAFRAELRPLVLPFPDDLPVLHDAWIAAIVGAAARALPLDPPPLVCYRQHEAQQNGGRRRRIDERTDAEQRAAAWALLLDLGRQVHDRLDAHRDAFDVGRSADRLADRLAHTRFRADLPSGLLSRSAGAIGELTSGRYHRFSNGLRSLARDLTGG